jgi:hypothetical protein
MLRDDDLVRDRERWLCRTRKTSSEVGSGGSFGHVEKLRVCGVKMYTGKGPTALEELGASARRERGFWHGAIHEGSYWYWWRSHAGGLNLGN